MKITVDDVMVREVATASPGDTVGGARAQMLEGKFHALPVVDDRGHPVGMVTSSDLLEDVADDMSLHEILHSGKVYSVPQYDGVHVAARVMRNHKLHHLVVTHEQQVVGVLSAFDLLKLVEEHRFTMKNPPAAAKHQQKRQ